MRKINIAFIIDQLSVGGTERQLLDLVRGLDPNRFRVTLVCLRDAPRSETSIAIPSQVVLGLRKILSPRGFQQIYRLSRFLRKENVHIVQTFFFDSTVVGVLAGVLARSPIVISARRDLGFWATPRLRFVLKRLDRWLDSYLVNSSAIREYLIRDESVQPEKIHVIHNGVDIQAFSNQQIPPMESVKSELAIPLRHNVIGVVANLNRSVKRVDVFIRAAAEIHGRRDDVVFLVIGDGHLKSQLLQLSRDLGVEKSVFWAGSVPDVAPLVSILDIGVLPSDSEGLPNALLEYMAAGVPSVVTDVGGNHDIIQEGFNGLLVPPNDPTALAKGILALLEDPVRHAAMKHNARKTADAFSQPSMIAKHESFYESLINRSLKGGTPDPATAPKK